MVRVLQRGTFAVIFLVEVVERFFEDESPKLAAALAYYAIFSIPPLLIILLTSVQFFFAQAEVDAVLRPLATNLLSERIASEVIALSLRARQWAEAGPWWSVALSVGGVLFAATRGLTELQSTLNRIWGIAPSPEQGFAKTFAVKRFVALLIMAGLSLLLAVSIAVDTFLVVWGSRLLASLSAPLLTAVRSLDGALSVVLTTALLTAIYRLLPDAKITTRHVLPGALFAAFLFEVAKRAFASFIGQLQLGEFFGQASSLMALLVWLYICGLLVTLGAEFTQVWTLRNTGPVDADDGLSKEKPRALVITPKIERLLQRWSPHPPA